MTSAPARKKTRRMGGGAFPWGATAHDFTFLKNRRRSGVSCIDM